MRKSNGNIVSGQNVRASEETVLRAQNMIQAKLIRELTCMFAAHLIYAHDGKAFVPMSIAAECFGDPNQQHGYYIMIDSLEALGTHRVRAFMPDETPYVAPVTPREAKEQLPEDAPWALRAALEMRMLPEGSDLFANAEVIEKHFKAAREKALQVPVPEAPQDCLNSFHSDKDATGLLCSDCGRRYKIASA